MYGAKHSAPLVMVGVAADELVSFVTKFFAVNTSDMPSRILITWYIRVCSLGEDDTLPWTQDAGSPC